MSPGDATVVPAAADTGASEQHDARAEAGVDMTREAGDTAAGDACVTCADAEPQDDGAIDASDASTADADSDAASERDCRSFPVFDRACRAAEDCALGARAFDCCGSMLVTGVRAEQKAAFERAANACRPAMSPCDCASRPTRADDGSVDTFGNSSLPRVECVNGQCWSSFTEFSGKTPCGDEGDACEAAYEVCITRTPVGGGAVHDCVTIPRACQTSRSCECMGEALCDETFYQCSDGVFANNITCTCPDCP